MRTILVGVVLFSLTWIVFGQTLGHDFVNYDDYVYVLQNQQVRSGVTLGGIVWAFGHEHAGNWHPLTTISHMLDVQMFGLTPAGHHFVNVFLHAVAVLLLFFLLRQLTGAFWRSALVAAIFAIHPLRAESVAWVAERKDVLSAVFFMLTLAAYARYAHKRSVGRYIGTAVLLACGLLSKPMLVTVPFLLLLLDDWPLNRSSRRRIRPSADQRAKVRGLPTDNPAFRRGQKSEAKNWLTLVVEKIPLIVICVPTAMATFVIQERSSGSIAQLPLAWRVENAVVSYVTYMWQMIWPVNLAVFYPHPENCLALWQVALAALLLLGITAFVFALRATRPYLLVGWLWYLGMLLPVIGLVQVGLQGHADRYTYLPQIGLYLAVIWLAADLVGALRYRRQVAGVLAVAVIVILSACSWKQVARWKDSETLWRHALAVTQDNDVAQTNLGMVLAEGTRIEEGIEHLQSALAIRSGSVHPHYTLSLALIHCDLGFALARQGVLEDAVRHLRTAVELQPNYADAHYNLATALAQEGRGREAIEEYRRTLELRPADAEAHTSLGNILVQEGFISDAMAQYEAALPLASDAILPRNNLAWILAASPDPSVRNGARAVELAQRAVQTSGGRNALFLRTLAAAYAEAGRFKEAVETAQRAWQLADADNHSAGRHVLEQDLDLYRAKAPLRDPSLANVTEPH